MVEEPFGIEEDKLRTQLLCSHPQSPIPNLPLFLSAHSCVLLVCYFCAPWSKMNPFNSQNGNKRRLLLLYTYI